MMVFIYPLLILFAFLKINWVADSPGLSIEQALKILKTYAGNNKAGERKKRGRKRDKKEKKKDKKSKGKKSKKKQKTVFFFDCFFCFFSCFLPISFISNKYKLYAIFFEEHVDSGDDLPSAESNSSFESDVCEWFAFRVVFVLNSCTNICFRAQLTQLVHKYRLSCTFI